MRILLACLLIIVSWTSVANEETIETWNCTESSNTKEVLVKAISIMPSGYGDIEVAGIKHEGFYSVDGFDRRWNFGSGNGNAYEYAFIITPKGAGNYYDFTGEKESVKPSQFFYCKKAVAAE